MSTKKEDRDAIVQQWVEMEIPMERLQAQANAHVNSPAATRRLMPPAQKAQKKRRRSEDSSEDESSDDDEADDDCTRDEMSCDEGEESEGEDGESEDESEDGEEMWNVKRILKERKRGKQLEYQVEWEGDEWAGQYTWEPLAIVEKLDALKEFLAARNAPGAKAS